MDKVNTHVELRFKNSAKWQMLMAAAGTLNVDPPEFVGKLEKILIELLPGEEQTINYFRIDRADEQFLCNLLDDMGGAITENNRPKIMAYGTMLRHVQSTVLRRFKLLVEHEADLLRKPEIFRLIKEAGI